MFDWGLLIAEAEAANINITNNLHKIAKFSNGYWLKLASQNCYKFNVNIANVFTAMQIYLIIYLKNILHIKSDIQEDYF